MSVPIEVPNIESLRTLRSVSTQANKAVSDARYWAEQMAAVADRRDRESFMRIYDHYAPRLQRYLLGLGVNASQAEELV